MDESDLTDYLSDFPCDLIRTISLYEPLAPLLVNFLSKQNWKTNCSYIFGINVNQYESHTNYEKIYRNLCRRQFCNKNVFGTTCDQVIYLAPDGSLMSSGYVNNDPTYIKN